MKKLLLSTCCVLVLGGCSYFNKSDSLPVQRDTAGEAPYTKDVLARLPEGLIGDTQNARHTNDILRGDTGGN